MAFVFGGPPCQAFSRSPIIVVGMSDEDGRQYKYTVLLDPDEDEGGYTVTVPALPGVISQGETIDEALAMARDAIELYIEDLVEDGQPIPIEHVPPQLLTVTVAA